MLKHLIVLCAIATTTVLCRNTASNYNSLHSDQFSDKDIGNNDKSDESYLNWMDISSIYHKYKNYTSSDISVFLKLKLLSSLNAVAKGDIDFGNGIRFVKDHSVNENDSEAEFSENTILKSMPRTLGESEDYLSSKVWKRINKLLRSHTIQVSRQFKQFCKDLIKFFKFMHHYLVPHFLLDTLYLVDDHHIKMKQKYKKQKQKKQKQKKRKKKPTQQQPQTIVVYHQELPNQNFDHFHH